MAEPLPFGQPDGMLRGLLYGVAFVLPPLLVGGATAWRSFHAAFAIEEPAPLAGPMPAPPAIDPDRPLAVLLVSNRGTEVLDLIAPHAILQASGRWQAVTVAPERRPSPLTGGVDLLPHFAFDELGSRTPELVVVPALLDADDPRHVTWLREVAARGARVLSICEGARTVAAAGLFSGRRATTHFFAIDGLERRHPEATWVRDVRFVVDGPVVSSAGVTAAIDATLAFLDGEDSERAAVALSLRPGPRRSPAPALTARDLSLAFLAGGFTWRAEHIGVRLAPGMDGLALASLIDTYPRSFTIRTLAVADTVATVRTAQGLDLVPRSTPEPGFDRILSADDLPADVAGALGDLARATSVPQAELVAKMIEFPLPGPLEGPGWPLALALRPVALGFAGLALAHLLLRRIGKRGRLQ